MTLMTLQAAAWDEAAKPKALPEGLYNKLADNQQLLQKILQLGQLELENTLTAFKNPNELEQVLRALVNRGFIITEDRKEELDKFKQNLADVFEIGLNTGTTPPPAASSIVQTTMVDSVMQLVTNLDTDLKKNIGKILSDGYAEKKFPRDIVKQMSDEIGISQSRAKKIATTETMRGSNAASWTQNHSEGMKYFVVDVRAAACKDCIRHFSGRVFKISETRYIPPIHPFCACVPIYFATKAEAQDYAKKIQRRNELERDLLKKQGFKLPKDGTGPNATGKEQAKIIKQVNKESLKGDVTSNPPNHKSSSISTAAKTPTQIETNLGTFNPGVYKLVSTSKNVKTISGVKVGGGVRLKEGTFTRFNYYDGQDNVAILFKKGLPKKFQNPEDILNVYKQMSPTLKGNVDRIIATTGSGRGLGYHVNHRLVKDDIYIAPRAIGNDPDKLAHTILHESGHAYDYSFIPYRSQGKLIKPERPFRWMNSMNADKELGKDAYVTGYARNGINEDFAESVALYHADPKQFKIDFPSRYETLRKVM